MYKSITESLYCMKVKVLVAQLCLTLCDPVDCSLPGSCVHRISQARILEWVAISFSRGSSQPRDWTWVFFTAGRFFTFWATREAQKLIQHYKSIIPQYKIEFKKLYIFHHSFLLYFKKFSFMNNCSVQFSSVVQSCPTLCDPMNHSTPGLPVHHQLLEFTQTHVHPCLPSIGYSCSHLSTRISSFSKWDDDLQFFLSC